MSRAAGRADWGAGELGRARGHVERAVAELRAARQAWGVWADCVRERAELRLGVTSLDDPRVIADPEYGRALDAGAEYVRALAAAEALLQATAAAASRRACPDERAVPVARK